jgi:hypothetical protein
LFSRRVKWPLFAALIALVLAICISAGMQEAKIYNQRELAKAGQQNSQPGNSTAAPSHPKQSEERKQEGHWYGAFLNHPTDWLLVLFNGILAAFTIRLFYATSGLAAETAGLRSAADKQSADMQASIKASIDSAKAAIASNQIAVVNTEQQLRAYVTAADVHVLQHRRPGTMSGYGTEIPGQVHTYEFSVILKNGGQTPAINVRTNINLKRFEGEAPNDFDFPSSDLFGYGLIGPQIEWRTPYQVASAGLVEDIGPAMLLWGWIEYDDIFTASGSTARHRTEFCYRVDRRRLPVTNELWMGFIPHDRFNAADDDCLRPIDPATGQGGG